MIRGGDKGRGVGMSFRDVVTDEQRSARQAEMVLEDAAAEHERQALDDAARRGNRDFTQVYPKGWARIRQLINTNPTAAKLFTFLAEHIDGACGAVVVSQELLAKELGVHVITVKRQTKLLEELGAIVRIRVGTGVYAYAVDPSEVWRSWDDKKDLAAFATRTLVAKKDRANGQVRRKLKVMMGESDPN